MSAKNKTFTVFDPVVAAFDKNEIDKLCVAGFAMPVLRSAVAQDSGCVVTYLLEKKPTPVRPRDVLQVVCGMSERRDVDTDYAAPIETLGALDAHADDIPASVMRALRATPWRYDEHVLDFMVRHADDVDAFIADLRETADAIGGGERWWLHGACDEFAQRYGTPPGHDSKTETDVDVADAVAAIAVDDE